MYKKGSAIPIIILLVIVLISGLLVIFFTKSTSVNIQSNISEDRSITVSDINTPKSSPILRPRTSPELSLEEKAQTKPSPVPSPSPLGSPVAEEIPCARYEVAENEYLMSYTAEEGDTIFSIAFNETGGLTKASQLIILNPGFDYSEYGSVPSGREIILPKEYFRNSTGVISTVAGKVLFKENGVLRIQSSAGSEEYNTVVYENPADISAVVVVHCLDIFLDEGNSNKPFQLRSQV